MLKNVHGGDIYFDIKTKWIDFSANINPLGIPPNLRNTFIKSFDFSSCYPDPFCRELTKSISLYEKVLKENIFCGNGAADLIYRICYGLKPKKALILAPTFLEYELALKSVGSNIKYYYLKEENEFNVLDNIIEYIKDIDIIFICNPNNPTGAVINKELMLKIINEAKINNIFIVVDECFNDFLDEKEKYTVKESIFYYDKLIILKAFTKIFAMAGIRIGYCMFNNINLKEILYNSYQPWGVSVTAQMCATEALKEKQYLKKTMEIIKEERQYLYNGIVSLGFKVFKPSANYIMFKTNFEIIDKLKENHILIRDCRNYINLTKGFYRIAVKERKENEILLNVLKGILNG